VVGEFDRSTKGELEKLLDGQTDDDVAVLDLGGVTFLDSSAINCFLRLRKRMQERGGEGIIRIANANSMIRRVFKICGLDEIFELYDSLDSAQRA